MKERRYEEKEDWYDILRVFSLKEWGNAWGKIQTTLDITCEYQKERDDSYIFLYYLESVLQFLVW